MIYNTDCITGAKKYFPDESMDLIICDPPFGINETSFHKHYRRKEEFVIEGYKEAPDDYLKFSIDWIEQSKRILKSNGSMYVISGWSKLGCILRAIEINDLYTINHIIWKFNFGVFTQKKYVSSHYHILFLKKQKSSKHKFNTYCRFSFQEKDCNGNSMLYKDLEDVFVINKEFMPKQIKNKNKLPDELIQKMILYSSKRKDNICDFFLGNFTTAFVSKKLDRIPHGFELNKDSFQYYMPKLDDIENGCDLDKLKKVVNKLPINSGKKISDKERNDIIKDYVSSMKAGTKQNDINLYLCEKYGRGKFSIKNIIDKWKQIHTN